MSNAPEKRDQSFVRRFLAADASIEARTCKAKATLLFIAVFACYCKLKTHQRTYNRRIGCCREQLVHFFLYVGRFNAAKRRIWIERLAGVECWR